MHEKHTAKIRVMIMIKKKATKTVMTMVTNGNKVVDG
jgi:hypothetical protein